MKNRNKVLVIGCHVSGLAVIRALGKKNIHIVAMSYENTDFGNVSKYVSERTMIPHPRLEEKAFINFLIENSHRWSGALIIDTDDNGAVTISKHKHVLTEYYKVCTAEWELLRKFIEKKEAHKLCQECNTPHPKNFVLKDLEYLDKINGQVMYPCILKPVRGHEFFSRFNVKNFEVNNDSELTSKFRLCLEAEQEVMLQEIIPGPETNLYKMQTYVNSKGELSAKFFWNKIRQHPPMFGVGRVGVSRERSDRENTFEEVERLAKILLKHSKYKGYFSIEFKKDPRDNQLKLMEVNVRMPRNGALAIESGVNIPWIIYKDLVENEQIVVNDYKKNFYWIEIYIDVYNAIFNRKKENFTFREYIEPYLSRNKVFAVFSLHDIKPFLKQTLVFGVKLFKR